MFTKILQSGLNALNKRMNGPVAVPKSPLPNAGGAAAVVVGAVVVGAPSRLDNVGVELLLVAAAVADAVDVAVEPNRPVPLVLEPRNIFPLCHRNRSKSQQVKLCLRDVNYSCRHVAE